MIEKQNNSAEKRAAGDSGAIDDIVEGAASRFVTRQPLRRPRPRPGIAGDEAKEAL